MSDPERRSATGEDKAPTLDEVVSAILEHGPDAVSGDLKLQPIAGIQLTVREMMHETLLGYSENTYRYDKDYRKRVDAARIFNRTARGYATAA